MLSAASDINLQTVAGGPLTPGGSLVRAFYPGNAGLCGP